MEKKDKFVAIAGTVVIVSVVGAIIGGLCVIGSVIWIVITKTLG